MPSLFHELKRRNVVRGAALYLAAAWLILQVADIVLDAFDASHAMMRILIVAFTAGFPVFLLLSWFYEFRGARLVRDTGESAAKPRSWTAPAANITIAVLVILGTGIFLFTQTRTTGEAVNRDISAQNVIASGPAIAVLPLANTSSDPGNEYVADGLTEELLNTLTLIPQLKVTARASSFALKDAALDAPTIGKQLMVDHILEGSVRKEGDKLRISVQLVSADTGRTAWSATYDRNFEDVFEIQKDIAQQVSGTLQLSLFSDPTPIIRRTTPEAYSAYLRGLYQYRTLSPEGYAEAVAALQTAIALDEEYAPAWTLLASVRSNQAIIGAIDYAEGYEMARASIERALSIDPNYAFAISSRAWIAMSHERDLRASARYFKRALELAPNDAAILGNFAVLTRLLGRPERAVELTQMSLARDPLSAAAFNNLSDQLYQARRFSDAKQAAKRALQLAPGSPSAAVNLAVVQLFMEDPSGALETVASVERPFYAAFIAALANFDLGRPSLANSALATMIEDYADQRAIYIAAVHAYRGQKEEAFRWLQKAIDERQRTLAMRTDPLFDNLHEDPRWQRVLEQLGLSDQQVAGIEI
jgi:TolB-like protein/Tfp pilus assembly protein PilF